MSNPVKCSEYVTLRDECRNLKNSVGHPQLALIAANGDKQKMMGIIHYLASALKNNADWTPGCERKLEEARDLSEPR